jgi:hypothetical protein
MNSVLRKAAIRQIGALDDGHRRPSLGSIARSSKHRVLRRFVRALPLRLDWQDQPSIIIVEVLGFGGGGGEEQPDSEQRRSSGRQSSNNYDSRGMVRVLGNGTFTAEDTKQLTAEERNTLTTQVSAPGSP